MAQINTIPADESEPLLLRSGSKTKRKSLAGRAAAFSLVLGCLAATAIASSGGFRGATPEYVAQVGAPCMGYAMDDISIRTAVTAWLADATAAEETYGHISTWCTGGVTDMSTLFCAVNASVPVLSSNPCTYENINRTCHCNAGAVFFNEDIGAWDTSGVTRMNSMFYYASAFDQDISGWAVDSVTDMGYMFFKASAFDQDLGWCLDRGVNTWRMFEGAGCTLRSYNPGYFHCNVRVRVLGAFGDCVLV